MSIMKRFLGILALLAVVLAPSLARGQAQTPTTVNVSGGSQGATQTVPTGETRFGLRVPLKPNAENTLSLVATDTDGRTAKVDNLKVAQISLTEIVQARVTATRLSTPEVKQLVAEGVINLQDPDNYNVSRFVVALVVNGREVQVPVPVVRHKKEIVAEGPPVSVGCAGAGQGVSTTERAIFIPCGDGGNASDAPPPPMVIIPFEVASPVEGMPSIPGVILIEGRIKTLKEFFKVDLLLMNVSSLFTLTELTARLEIPEDALTAIAPAGGSIPLSDIGPVSDTTGQFIVRGDTKGIHTVTAHFGGKITGSFLPEPVPFSGSASTDVEVKGPPKLDVKVTHPDHVVANEPYDLVITITNTDDTLDALYTSMAIDVGGGANLIDEMTGDEIDGPVVRTLGDILRGQTIVQTYKVMPRLSGMITSCVGAADANINLSVDFVGGGPGCAIGLLPSDRLSPDGKPTVTVVPTHNTVDVSVDPPIVALFSDRMIEPTITSGYPGATFNLLDANNNVVSGSVTFTELFEATAAIFRPSSPLAYGAEYTIVVNPSIFNLDGIGLASGIAARFTTGGAPVSPDTVAPAITLTVEPPFSPQSIGLGQSLPVIADATDAHGVKRVDLFLDGELIDTKKPNSPARFLVETTGLEAGSAHDLTAIAYDTIGNFGTTVMTINIAPDMVAPVLTVTAQSAVGAGQPLPIAVQATDDGRVAKVEIFVDTNLDAAATGLVDPFQFAIQTIGLSAGQHTLRIVGTDGAGNRSEVAHPFEVTSDTTTPVITLVSPGTFTFAPGALIPFVANATDAGGVATIAYRLDVELSPRATGPGGLILDTTGLTPGAHVVTIVATDTSGNVATLPVSFSLEQGPPDNTAPAAANTALITLGPVTNGVVSITGAAGAVEAGAKVVIVNGTTQAGAQATATPAGAFSTQIEAAGGDILSFVVIDAAGNQSPAVAMAVPTPLTLTSIAVTPSSFTLNRSQTSRQLVVTGTFSDGSQQTITSGLTFASSAPTIASATAGGLVLPGQNGAATITVSVIAPGVSPVTVAVAADFSTITGITASPNPLTITGLGRGGRIAVSALYSDNSTGPFTGTVRFATANSSIAIVDNTGQVTSTGIGSTQISIAANNLPPTSVLVVVEAVQPSELLVTPTALSFTSLGESQTLQTRFRYTDGTTGSGPFPVTFASLNEAVATVTSSGSVMATGEGSTSIVVQSLTFSVSVSINVTVPTTLPAPVITALGRPIAGEGDTLAILGRNFSGVPAQNFVTIGGLPAEAIGASFDRVIARVPVGATTGMVQVRVGGQDSNPKELSVYERRAKAVLSGAPFDASPAASGQIADLGSATFHLHPGDDVLLAGDPNTINASTWTSLIGPAFTGRLIVTVNGVEHTFSSSSQPIDLGSVLPVVSAPTLVTVGVRIEAIGSALSSRGLAVVAGPPSTGAFVGQRFLTGDTIGQEMVVRFRVAAPDGTKFAATASPWYRVADGGWNNGSAGGTIVDGVPTPNHGSFRTFTVTGGEVAVTYSDAGVFADFAAPRSVTIALVPANAANNKTADTPVAEAKILMGALDSASILPQQISAVADGVDRPIAVDINSVRDNYGNGVTDGTRIAITSSAWYRRSDGGWNNASPGGIVSGGVETPNDSRFRTYTLIGGAAQATYSPGSLVQSSGSTATVVLAATTANHGNSRENSRPFGEGTILLSSPGAATVTATALPSVLPATGGDNRSVVTLSNMTDAAGRPVPDGMRIAVTADAWYRVADGGWHNQSFGGSILGGDSVSNDSRFRSFVVNGGQVTFTYSNIGLVLGTGGTATTVISILPAAGNGERIGSTPFADVRLTQAGLTSATVVATPPSTLADGARRPIAIAVTNIRDALGNTVPDGTRIALTADAWYRRDDGGWNNGSVGGTFLDGVGTPNDSRFKTYTVQNGRVDATYSAETIAPLAVTNPRSSVIAVVVASPLNNHRLQDRPFAEGVVATSGVATATAVTNPTSLVADRQDRIAVVTVSGLTDAQGRVVPDGTKVAITARPWYRLADGGWNNSSAGGTMTGGDPTPNDSTFRTYTVTGGQVTATYSSAGVFVERGATNAAVLSVLGATPSGDRIAERPFAAATVTLAGLDTGTFTGPATVSPGSTTAMTLTNIRDAVGNLVPDGTRIAVTAAVWYNRDGGWHNGSAGGAIGGGEATPNDGSFRTFVVTGGQVTFSFTAPPSANVTTVISAISADGANNRNHHIPFTTAAVRAQ
jgi:hypothetical protein